jgi:HlyD family secretion protein
MKVSLLVVALLLWIAICGGASADSPLGIVRARGTVEPGNLVEVVAELPGRIKSIGVDPRDAKKKIDFGTRVKAGMTLLEVDSGPYAVALEKAKADLAQALAKRNVEKAYSLKAQANLERQAALAKTSASSSTEARDAQLELDVTRAKIEAQTAVISQRQAELKIAQKNLERCTIVSPVDGEILDQRLGNSGVVTANQTVFLIADASKKMQVWVSVSEGDIAKVAKGQRAHFTVEALPGKTFIGSVSQIRLNAQMLKDEVFYTVVVDIDDDHGLLPYLTADVTIDAGAAK